MISGTDGAVAFAAGALALVADTLGVGRDGAVAAWSSGTAVAPSTAAATTTATATPRRERSGGGAPTAASGRAAPT
jgi:hypothetical protein